MKTRTMLLLGATGVGGYFLYKHFYPSAPASSATSTTGMYVTNPTLGDYPVQPYRRRRRMGYNGMQAAPGTTPWQFSSIEYGTPGGPYGWTPYSRAAAFGPSPVEMETPSSLSFMASQIDAGF